MAKPQLIRERFKKKKITVSMKFIAHWKKNKPLIKLLIAVCTLFF